MSHLILGPLIGGLDSTGVNLWGRADGPGVLHAWVGQREDLSDARPAGHSLPLSVDTAFAGVAPVRGLQPGTRYHYALTLAAGKPGPDHPHCGTFVTAPSKDDRAVFRFAFGSCFLPEGTAGGKTFAEMIKHADTLSFLLMVGDQIYADDGKREHTGLDRVALTRADYNAVYAYVWSNPALRALLKRVPVFMTGDDHEVDDDWRWSDESHDHAVIPPWDTFLRWLHGRSYEERIITLARVRDALQAYWDHQLMHAPPLLRPPQEFTERGQYVLGHDQAFSLAYTFDYGPAAFFVMDTRSMRVRPQGRAYPIMLDEAQWQDLEAWLEREKDRPVRFIVTSSACLFQMWTDIPGDRWSLYHAERDRLFGLLASKGKGNCYLLTGDLHSGHAISADLYGPDGQPLKLWEFCATPFEQNPNWMARWTHSKVGPPLRNERCHFVHDNHNFGVIEVNCADPARPRVRFELHFRDEKKGWLVDSIEAGS